MQAGGLFVALVMILAVVSGAFAQPADPTAAVFDDPDASAQDLLLAFAALRGEDVDRAPVPGVDAPASADWASAILGLYGAVGIQATGAEVSQLRAQSALLDDGLESALAPLVDALALAHALSAAGERTEAALLVLDAVDAARPKLTQSQSQPTNTDQYPECLGPVTQNSSFSVVDACDTRHDVWPDGLVWPPVPVADPVGLVAVHTEGDDVHTLNRFLDIDPAGNDTWKNNAGGACSFWGTGSVFDPKPWVCPWVVSLAWDLGGNDTFTGEGQGSGHRGIGVLIEEAGDDNHSCADICLGAGTYGGTAGGIGIFQSLGNGNDRYYASSEAMGYGRRDSAGLFLEEGGSDTYEFYSGVGWAYASEGDAYFRDRAGQDSFEANGGVLGRAFEGRAYFRDFGGALESYIITAVQHPAENGKKWYQLLTNGPNFAGEGWDDG